MLSASEHAHVVLCVVVGVNRATGGLSLCHLASQLGLIEQVLLSFTWGSGLWDNDHLVPASTKLSVSFAQASLLCGRLPQVLVDKGRICLLSLWSGRRVADASIVPGLGLDTWNSQDQGLIVFASLLIL